MIFSTKEFLASDNCNEVWTEASDILIHGGDDCCTVQHGKETSATSGCVTGEHSADDDSDCSCGNWLCSYVTGMASELCSSVGLSMATIQAHAVNVLISM